MQKQKYFLWFFTDEKERKEPLTQTTTSITNYNSGTKHLEISQLSKA